MTTIVRVVDGRIVVTVPGADSLALIAAAGAAQVEIVEAAAAAAMAAQADQTDPTKGTALIGWDTLNTTLKSVVDSLTAGRLEGRNNLRNLMDRLYKQQASPSLFAVVTLGDSVSPRVGEHLVPEIRSRYGDGGHVFPIQSNTADYGELVALKATTGTVTRDTSPTPAGTFPYLPNNSHFIMADGATLTFHVNGGHGTITRILAWLAKRPGDGSALLEVKKTADGTVLASWDTGSLSGTDGTLVKANGGAHFTGLDPLVPVELKITATGSVCFLTCGFLRDFGCVLWQAGRGGAQTAVQNGSAIGILQGILADIGAVLAVCEDKSEDGGASYPAMMARLQTIPAMDCIFVGSLPDSTTAASQKATRVALRNAALGAGYAFIDAYRLLKDYAEVTRLGANGDGTHLLTQAYWIVSQNIMAEFPLNRGRMPMRVRGKVQVDSLWVNDFSGYGAASQDVKALALDSASYRIEWFNIATLRFKTPSTNPNNETTGQISARGYSTNTVSFFNANGNPAWLGNLAGLAFGTEGGTGNSSATIQNDYVNGRVLMSMVRSNGTTVAPLITCGGIRVGTDNVIGAKDTGWGRITGTASKGAFATYTAPTFSTTPTMAESQAMADALQAATRRLMALDALLATTNKVHD